MKKKKQINSKLFFKFCLDIFINIPGNRVGVYDATKQYGERLPQRHYNGECDSSEPGYCEVYEQLTHCCAYLFVMMIIISFNGLTLTNDFLQLLVQVLMEK